MNPRRPLLGYVRKLTVDEYDRRTLGVRTRQAIAKRICISLDWPDKERRNFDRPILEFKGQIKKEEEDNNQFG